MPRFFFDVHNGHTDRDDEGIEYADSDTARREGLRASGEILRDRDDIETDNPWKMVVRDEVDTVVATFVFSVT